MEVRGSMSEEEVKEGRGPKVLRTMSSKVPGSKGPRVPRTKISQTEIQIRA